jgi:death-on-curing protein
MKMLTLPDVLRLHERIIQQSGGSFGVRNREAVESALMQALATFGDEELYPDLLDKAAVVGYLLIANHPFVDGNKRIGHAVMEVMLVLNGYELVADIDEQEQTILGVAGGIMDREQFTNWVRSRTKPL